MRLRGRTKVRCARPLRRSEARGETPRSSVARTAQPPRRRQQGQRRAAGLRKDAAPAQLHARRGSASFLLHQAGGENSHSQQRRGSSRLEQSGGSCSAGIFFSFLVRASFPSSSHLTSSFSRPRRASSLRAQQVQCPAVSRCQLCAWLSCRVALPADAGARAALWVAKKVAVFGVGAVYGWPRVYRCATEAACCLPAGLTRCAGE